MTPPRSIQVKLDQRSYPIWIGSDWLGRSRDQIRQATRSRQFLLLSSRPVFKLHGPQLRGVLSRLGRVRVHLMPDGERAKNERELFRVLGAMAHWGFQRDACVVTLGGGVVGDLGGLAASLYMRGVDFIQCPTTLLAQVDASVGGKTAIDFQGVKNLIGAFYQPRLVAIDTGLLRTLPDRLYRSGLAEVVKYGVIRDSGFFAWMEGHVDEILGQAPQATAHMVRVSCGIKADVVGADERESGVRAQLNFGHTLGHALEAHLQRDGLLHGEAVAFGMVLATRLSQDMGLCSGAVRQRLERLLARLGLLGPLPKFQPSQVIKLLSLDKKARSGKALFVLTRKIGAVSMNANVPNRLILRALRHLQAPRPDVSGPA